MIINLKDIMEAFEFVSFSQMHELQAFLNKETGKIFFYSEFGDNFEELPEDIDNGKYIEIPHKNELDLGKRLVMDFAYRHLPNEADKIESIFRRKGAYSKFKSLLESRGLIEKWHEFEAAAQEKALKAWCEANEIEFH